MTTTGTPRRADIGGFFTCRYPERFKIDWRTFYATAQARTDVVRAGWRHELDIAYGPHVQHRLDLYYPEPGRERAPVLLFLHGGGFREGDPALYGYLAEPFLQRGIIFGSVGYRLIPESYLPETMRDVEEALAWGVANLPARGGDPSQIVLAGHSAGAILTAHLSVRDDWLRQRSLPLDLIKGAIPISGVYDFSDPTDHAEFFTHDSQRLPASPLLNINTTPPPMTVAYGSLENGPRYGQDSQRLVDAVRAHGATADLLKLQDLDHADTVNALADQRSALCQSVVALISRPANTKNSAGV
jgi:arylformamidase